MGSGAGNNPGAGLRLIKLRLPANVIRAMDDVILGSNQAYLDRDEFVTEAVLGRLAEESPDTDRHRLQPDHVTREDEPFEMNVEKVTATITAPVSGGHNFGLHNRDLPTLWSVIQLVALTGGQPLPWATFMEQIRPRAHAAGAWLRVHDMKHDRAIKASIGFPRAGAKAVASEERFVTAAIGQPRGRAVAGPAFLLGLVAATATDPLTITITQEGAAVITALTEQGLSHQLPQPREAARTWLRHVQSVAPDEHKAWAAVLEQVSHSPTRTDLVAHFPQWEGSKADTNCMGYISRSREWGLVEPLLTGGRYKLTDLGRHVVTKGNDHDH